MTRRSPPDVMGLETELGVQAQTKGASMSDNCISESLSKEAFSATTDVSRNQGKDFWLTNGGRIYLDVSRWEICTPEVTNLRDFLIWQRAMERIITRSIEINPNLRVYKNNLDTPFKEPIFHQNTWGSHMNYTTSLHSAERFSLVLPTVLEKLLTGSGNLGSSGVFDISQRGNKVNNVHPDITEQPNPEGDPESRLFLLDGKDDHIELGKGKFLFHHTSNDSNMLDNAEWLKVGFMRNMICLAENGYLPLIGYDPRQGIIDLRHLITIRDIREDPSLTQGKWYIKSMPVEDRSALDLLKKYNDRARSELSGIDSETDFTIELTDYVISGLQRFGQDPNQLYGVLDWVTKRHLLTEKMKSEGLSPGSDDVQSINLEYHCLNSGSLFQDLKSMGGIEVVPTEEEIRNAMINPPANTRAYARGKIIEKSILGTAKNIDAVSWERVILKDNHNSEAHIKIPNARHSYSEKLPEWLSRIRLT